MRFKYGDAVIVTPSMEAGFAVNRPCAVVGITRVDNEEQSIVFGHAIGTTIYTVEFGDGSEELVPEEHLSLISE